MNTSDTQNTDDSSRPFGYWLKAVDRLMAAEFDAAFDGEHASRRDWRLLNVIDGTTPAHRPLNAHKLDGLVERGWVVADGDGWTLTDEGRAAKERLSAVVDGIRAKVADAVSLEDLDTTLASLEQIARAFGWDEQTPLPRGRGRRHGRGFGPGVSRGFGRRHGLPFGRGRGFAPGFDSGHGHGHEHGHRHGLGHESDAAFGRRECGHRGHPGHDRFANAHHPHHGRHGHPGDVAEDRDHRHGGHGHGHLHGHGHGHLHGHGHGHGHGGHGHGHGNPRRGEHRVARAAHDAYERGFDAGFSRGRDA
ncbi:hypothetical protein AB0N61_13385 [Microbacterium sp. NPDC089320]|uniref:MarR family winged helix-turn-helix transcriptional regulator n=1 Tax=Microbacterium sp. NPDC089320 TaxID=3155182 RepID=UPI00341AD79B